MVSVAFGMGNMVTVRVSFWGPLILQNTQYNFRCILHSLMYISSNT